MTTRLTLSILVVAYNSADCIAQCMASIPAASTGRDYEVLAIDNGDGTSEALIADSFPQVKIVPSRGNVGFAAANNILAREARGSHFLLINPDVELKPGAIDALFEGVARHPQAAAWGGVTLTPEGEPDFGNSVHVPSLREMASRIVGRSSAGLAGITLDADRRVEALSGSFVMFDRKAWEEIGGFDESYFLYCEEVDLFYRLARRGHSFWQIAKARAIHNIGHGSLHSPRRELFLTAGSMQFIRLHWSVPRQWLAIALLWLAALQRYFMGKLFGRWNAYLCKQGHRYSAVARGPRDWLNGYDPKRGLLCRLSDIKGRKANFL